MAFQGVPFRLRSATHLGAQLLRWSANSILEAVYRPELRTDSTEVRTTTLMMVLAAGMPILPKAAAYGLVWVGIGPMG